MRGLELLYSARNRPAVVDIKSKEKREVGFLNLRGLAKI